MLDRLRAGLPQTRSLLMYRGTLPPHGDRWVVEDRRPAGSAVSGSPSMRLPLSDRVSDRLGVKVRLRQARIDWD
jgi:hypothetical protein